MATPDPNPADLLVDFVWMDRQLHLDEVLSINARNNVDAWAAETYHHHLDDRYVVGKVAIWSGHVVGYVIYRLSRESIEVLKLEVDPEYHGRGILEQMIEKLARQLSPDHRKEVVFRIPEGDAEAVDILERCDRKSGIRRARRRRGVRCYILRYHPEQIGMFSQLGSEGSGWPSSGGDPGGVTSLEATVGEPAARRALPDELAAARRKLTELTRTEWDVVKPRGRTGRFVVVASGGDLDGVDLSDVYVRSAFELADPAAACEAFHILCGIPSKGSPDSRPEGPAQVVFPSTWLRRLAHGQPALATSDAFRAAFEPADRAAGSRTRPGRKTRRPGRPD